jgi:Flp pilus assembly protein TadG
MRNLLRRLSSDRRGGLIAEFAAAMPVLVLMLLGGVEVSRFALLNQKMDRLATSMGDLVSQAETLTTAEVDQLFLAAQHVAAPFDVQAKGRIIVTSSSIPVGQPAGSTVIVNWQRTTGVVDATSTIGTTTGAPAQLPSGLASPNQTVISAEVFYEFTPLLIGALVPAQRIYHRAFFRPRIGTLTTLG